MAIIVTGYETPDLDGYACTYAYAELLNKHGQRAVATIYGDLQPEPEFCVKELRIAPIEKGKTVGNDDKVVLVDASDTSYISNLIRPERVIEIIDHRKVHEAGKFPNAKVQIELVGSAATLVTERFISEGAGISHESAALLYAAIVSNTINFKAKVTTERDRNAAAWLRARCELPDDFIHRMFSYKSAEHLPLSHILRDGIAVFEHKGMRIGVAQLEIVNADAFIKQHLDEIMAYLAEGKAQERLDAGFLTCIDVEEGNNTFVAPTEGEERLLHAILQLEFKNHVAHRDGIIMRKEIFPLVKEHLEKNHNKKI